MNLNNDHSTLMFNANKRCHPPKGESRDFEPFGRVEPLNFQFDALSGCRVSDARRDCKTAVFTGYSNKTNKARRLSSTGFMKDGQVASPHQKTEVEAGWIEPSSRDSSNNVRFPGLTAELAKTGLFPGSHVHFAILKFKIPVRRGTRSFQEFPGISLARHNPV